MAGVREEGDRGACEDIPIKAGIFDFDIRLASIGLYIIWKFADENNPCKNQSEDRNCTDMSETAHVFNHREWEEDEHGDGDGLHSSVLPSVKESIVVLGAYTELLK
jgi:hypothetical protein